MENIEKFVEKIERLNPKVAFDFWVCVIFGNVPGNELCIPNGYYWDEDNSMITVEGEKSVSNELYHSFLYEYRPYCEKEGEGKYDEVYKELQKLNPKAKFEFDYSKLIFGSVPVNEIHLPVGYYWEGENIFTDKGNTKFGYYNTFGYCYKPSTYWLIKKVKLSFKNFISDEDQVTMVLGLAAIISSILAIFTSLF